MEVTWGALRTDKSYCISIRICIKQGKWIVDDALMGIDLVVITPDGDKITLDRLRCDTASEMLGIWMTPNGKNPN